MSDNMNDINALTSCIALVEQHSKPHVLSKGITLIAVALLLYWGIMNTLALFGLLALVGIVVLGIIEMVYAIRIGFDLSLLRKLAGKPGEIGSGLTAIDRALTQLHLLPSDKTGRSLDVRLQGCLRLFKIQIGVCVLQCMTILAVVALQV